MRVRRREGRREAVRARRAMPLIMRDDWARAGGRQAICGELLAVWCGLSVSNSFFTGPLGMHPCMPDQDGGGAVFLAGQADAGKLVFPSVEEAG